jgi:hypothetical protein
MPTRGSTINFIMKYFLTLILFLSIQSPSQARVPRMTVRAPDGAVKLLQLEQADVSVRLLGDLAETVLDLRFRNDGERAVEGEFVLPLPAGATVSGYALEVNGKLRDGVAVEKERARLAYESVKRRMIDPGLVEREAGNTYRTKVYPVPARGTKRLRISYTETLRNAPDGFTYSLPLDFPDRLESFSCKVRGTATGKLRVIDAAGLEFAAGGAGDLTANLKNAKPAGTLKLSVPPLTEPVMIVEDDAHPAFYLTMVVPDRAPSLRPAPSTVALIWDASQSGLGRDHAKEFSLLDKWFAKLGSTRVKLYLLRDRLEGGGGFEVRDGQWAKLKQTLQQIDYDGATSLSSLRVPAGTADLVVYVGDGINSLGAATPDLAAPLIFLHSGTPATGGSLARLARSSGGAVVDLATESPSAALAKLIQQPLRIVLEGAKPDAGMLDFDLQPGQRLRIFGSMLDKNAGNPRLRFGFDRPSEMRDITCQRDAGAAGIIRRLHAQRVLTGLEHQDCPARRQIIDHCKRHGLVSDYTSLIVLERIEDYAQYRIPPPEPELQADYQKIIAVYDKQILGRFANTWAYRLRWYGQRFPGYEALILPRLRQVGIWKKALESQFAPAQRDAQSFATIAGWFDQATGLIAGKPGLRTQTDYQKWRKAIDDLDAQGPKLAQTPVQPPPAGQALTVSVRGLVNQPGLVSGDPGMTLRQAITKAGGLHPLGGLDYVALYRNAGKTVYNTLSKTYQDVPLFPGDMLVVDQPPPNYSEPFSADPFAAESRAPGVRRLQAPASTQQDLWISPQAMNAAGGAGGASPAGNAWPRQPGADDPLPANETTGIHMELSEPAPAAMETFAKAIAAGGDAHAAYRKLKGSHIYQPRCDMEIARILFAKHHVELGTRVLSNLVELQPRDVSALRSYAFWLAEFGQSDEAELVLGEMPEQDLLTAMDLASIRATGGDLSGAAEAMYPPLEAAISGDGGNLAAIALTKNNTLCRFLGDADMPRFNRYPQDLPSDIRVTLMSTGDDSSFLSLRLMVMEPGFECTTDSSPSPYGGRVIGENGVREYLIRHAVPGIYQINCSSAQPATVRAVIHTHWGQKDQQTKVVTLWLEPGRTTLVGEVEYEFQPGP